MSAPLWTGVFEPGQTAVINVRPGIASRSGVSETRDLDVHRNPYRDAERGRRHRTPRCREPSVSDLVNPKSPRSGTTAPAWHNLEGDADRRRSADSTDTRWTIDVWPKPARLRGAADRGDAPARAARIVMWAHLQDAAMTRGGPVPSRLRLPLPRLRKAPVSLDGSTVTPLAVSGITVASAVFGIAGAVWSIVLVELHGRVRIGEPGSGQALLFAGACVLGIGLWVKARREA